MMFISKNPVPFTVKDLKKRLEYMDDNVPIRLCGQGDGQFLALVGRNNYETMMSFQKESYFTGWDFENNCEKIMK